MHKTTFEYLMPTEAQVADMKACRNAFAILAEVLDEHLPDGHPDKAYVLRTLRTAAMWTNVAITRNPDGSPKG